MKFMAIKDEIYYVLSMDKLRSMKITFFLKLKSSSFLVVCSSYGSDINSKDNLILCSPDGCLFKLCSKKCHHNIDQGNYCANCKRASIFVEDVDKIDSVERIYDNKLNEDFVTTFLTVDDDDDTNMNTADINTMISIACTTLCNVLPSYTCNIPEYIKNIIQEDFALPPIEHMDTVINNSSRSIVSKLSYNLYVTESVSDFREPYMIKEK